MATGAGTSATGESGGGVTSGMDAADASAEGSGKATPSAAGAELREVSHQANAPRTTTAAAAAATRTLLPERVGCEAG